MKVSSSTSGKEPRSTASACLLASLFDRSYHATAVPMKETMSEGSAQANCWVETRLLHGSFVVTYGRVKHGSRWTRWLQIRKRSSKRQDDDN